MRARVSDRLRRRLKQLLTHGAQRDLVAFSQKRPGGSRLTEQKLSNFKAGRRLHLDDLDDIADFFRVSIGELLGETKASDLTGDEQRMVFAFRALPEPTQEHFLALIEQASVAATAARFRSRQPDTDLSAATDGLIKAASELQRDQGEGGSLPARQIQALGRALIDAGTHLTGAGLGAPPEQPDRPVQDAGGQEPQSGTGSARDR